MKVIEKLYHLLFLLFLLAATKWEPVTFTINYQNVTLSNENRNLL